MLLLVLVEDAVALVLLLGDVVVDFVGATVGRAGAGLPSNTLLIVTCIKIKPCKNLLLDGFKN